MYLKLILHLFHIQFLMLLSWEEQLTWEYLALLKKKIMKWQKR